MDQEILHHVTQQILHRFTYLFCTVARECNECLLNRLKIKSVQTKYHNLVIYSQTLSTMKRHFCSESPAVFIFDTHQEEYDTTRRPE